MNAIEKIGKIEAIALFVTICINQIIFDIPNELFMSTGTGAWVNTIYISIFTFVIATIVYKLYKNFPNKDIVDISEYVGGKFLKIITSVIFLLCFISISAFCVRYFTNSIRILYYTSTPIVFLLILFLIPPVLSNKLGLKAISGINLILVPILLISTVVLFFANVKEFNFSNLFPILGYGADNVFLSGASNIFCFAGLLYLLFLPPYLKEHKHFKTISISYITFAGIFLLFTILSLLMSLAAISLTDELFSIYLLSRLIEFGTFFQRIDAVFIFIWFLAVFSFISFTFFITLHIFKKVTKSKHSQEMVYSLASIVFAYSLIFKNIANADYFARDIYKISSLIILAFSIVILVTANIKHKRNKKVN